MPKQSTRFFLPALTEQNIIRNNLVKQLVCIPCQTIIYIHAPAGYGNTTLAVQWLSKAKKSTAWLTLDEYSASPSEIYKGVLRSLSCQKIKDDDFSHVSLEYTLNILSTHDVWPQALVIDDFHFCSDTSVSKALPAIRTRLPYDMAFVVISRNPPHDVLGDQVIKGSVKQITGLQFEEYEIAELFEKNKLSISMQYAKFLKQQTDGWAAALSAILMADNYEPYNGLLDQNTLNYYLKSNVFEFNNDFDILKKCSISDVLYPAFCIAVTGQDAWKVIEALAKKTGLVTRLFDGSHRFHALIREFLQAELERDQNIDKTALYINAANWFVKSGDRFRALHMAAKSGDISEMEKMTRDIWGEYGSDNMDVAAYIHYIEECLLPIPRHISERYPRLSLQCFHGAFNCRPIVEIYSWLDVLEGHMSEGRYHQADYLSAAFLMALDPRQSSWHVPKQFERISGLMAAPVNQRPSVFTLSQNLPFFHKAQRDYTDIAVELPSYSEEIKKCMEPFMGPMFVPFVRLFEAGIYYEMGQLDWAEQIAAEVLQTSKNYPSEVRFCAYALYYEILRLLGKHFDLSHIGNMIAETKSNYLVKNFNAYETDTRLYCSDKTAASQWLSKYETDDTLRLYKIAQYFTAARAMIVLNKFPDALRLIERLVDFSKDFRRNADCVEAMAMQSICHWNTSHCDEAITVMSTAIKKAMELQIITPITKNGNDVIPILKKILNRLKHGYGADVLDKTFVNKVFISAKTISQNMCGMLLRSDSKPVALSQRQKEMLGYLVQNLTYQEISDITGIKITTVRDHITKLYEKLEVSTAMDAVIRAKELSLLI